MKTISGYLILFVSFFGLIYLKHFFSYSKGQVFKDRSVSTKRYFTSQVKIDSKMRNRISKLEKVVDSLMVKNEGLKIDSGDDPAEKIPIMEPTRQLVVLQPNKSEDNKRLFPSLNEAAKVRDSRTKLSLIAQEYINLAYEMGGDNWYGAEKVWGTEDFNNRVNELYDDD